MLFNAENGELKLGNGLSGGYCSSLYREEFGPNLELWKEKGGWKDFIKIYTRIPRT